MVKGKKRNDVPIKNQGTMTRRKFLAIAGLAMGAVLAYPILRFADRQNEISEERFQDAVENPESRTEFVRDLKGTLEVPNYVLDIAYDENPERFQTINKRGMMKTQQTRDVRMVDGKLESTTSTILIFPRAFSRESIVGSLEEFESCLVEHEFIHSKIYYNNWHPIGEHCITRDGKRVDSELINILNELEAYKNQIEKRIVIHSDGLEPVGVSKRFANGIFADYIKYYKELKAMNNRSFLKEGTVEKLQKKYNLPHLKYVSL